MSNKTLEVEIFEAIADMSQGQAQKLARAIRAEIRREMTLTPDAFAANMDAPQPTPAMPAPLTVGTFDPWLGHFVQYWAGTDEIDITKSGWHHAEIIQVNWNEDNTAFYQVRFNIGTLDAPHWTVDTTKIDRLRPLPSNLFQEGVVLAPYELTDPAPAVLPEGVTRVDGEVIVEYVIPIIGEQSVGVRWNSESGFFSLYPNNDIVIATPGEFKAMYAAMGALIAESEANNGNA